MKKQVSKSVKATYQGSTHTDVDTSALIWRIANNVREWQMQMGLSSREGVTQPKLVTNLKQSGRQKFESSSLAAFNKKINDLKSGSPAEREVDDIAPLNFRVEIPIANDAD